MSEVKVTHLRQQLQKYLALAAGGERVRVTHRGRVLAEIVAPTSTADAQAAVRARLLGSVLKCDAPLEPVLGEAEWDMQR